MISIHVLREEDDDFLLVGDDERENFNPRPPRGGRLVFFEHGAPDINISIHVLREEDDGRLNANWQAYNISIHVLREEDD